MTPPEPTIVGVEIKELVSHGDSRGFFRGGAPYRSFLRRERVCSVEP